MTKISELIRYFVAIKLNRILEKTCCHFFERAPRSLLSVIFGNLHKVLFYKGDDCHQFPGKSYRGTFREKVMTELVYRLSHW